MKWPKGEGCDAARVYSRFDGQFVQVGRANPLKLSSYLEQGYTFTPLVAMPSEIWQTLRDAVLQRKLDLWSLAGASTEEIGKTEKLVERYDRAFEWLDGLAEQEASHGQ